MGVAEGLVEEDEGEAKGSVTFVLQRANLSVGKVGKGYQILNCDDHKNFLRRNKKDPANYRPDIIHQALLTILDSPLNKAGRVKGVYVQTEEKTVFSVNPQTRLPRTFRRFCGLMVQLLQKLSVRSTNGPAKLLKVVKQPVTRHLPPGAHRIGLSVNAPIPNSVQEFVDALPSDEPIVFVVGAMAHGKIDETYLDEITSVSHYPLSAMCALGRLTTALETKWKIL